LMATKAASTKEERKGAKNAAKKIKIPTLPRRSNRTGRSIRYRTQPAPTSASHELLMNQQKIIVGGTLLCSCAARWAGNAASKITHQTRTGVRRNAASKMELGGQRTETGGDRRFNENQIFATRYDRSAT